MQETLYIENFGPIKKATLDLRQTMVFIGPQSSGKSTIAKLIAIMRDGRFMKQENFIDLAIGFNLELFIKKDTVIKYTNSSYSFSFEKNIPLYEVSNTSIVNLAYATYVPAERILISLYSDAIFTFLNSNLPIPKTILHFGAIFQTAKKAIASMPLSFLSFGYSNENGEDYIYYNENEKMRLSESSSGIQTLLPLLIVINYYSIGSYIIEEPEQNLYPQTQKDLIYYLTNKCIGFPGKAQKGSGLLITTHSPYTLTSFNNLLFAYQVAQKKKEDINEIEKIITQESWVNPDEFNAYFVADGTVREIFNRDTGLIDENELDSASEEINGDFEQLMEIYKGIKA